MPRVIPLKADRAGRLEWSAERLLELLEQWRWSLQANDRSPGTVKKYVQAVSYFLAWYEYEQEEQVPLQMTALTPIALIGYRNYMQHEQQRSVSTINLRISALRAWCAWLLDQGYVSTDPAARVKLVSSVGDGVMGRGGAGGSKREGLSSTQVNALLRQAQTSRDSLRNYAILQVLLQTGIRLSECGGLRFGDITFGERSGALLVRAGKGNKARTVPLNASARDALATYVAPRLDVMNMEKVSRKVVAAKWPKPKSPQAFEPVWLSRKGGALTTSAMGQMRVNLSRPQASWSRKIPAPILCAIRLRAAISPNIQEMWLG